MPLEKPLPTSGFPQRGWFPVGKPELDSRGFILETSLPPFPDRFGFVPFFPDGGLPPEDFSDVLDAEGFGHPGKERRGFLYGSRFYSLLPFA